MTSHLQHQGAGAGVPTLCAVSQVAHPRRRPGCRRAGKWGAGVSLAVLVLAGWALQAQANDTIALRVEPAQVRLGETVRVLLDVEGQQVRRVHADLDQDWQIIGQSTSTSMHVGPEGMRSVHRVELALRPRRPGVLTVPPLGVETASGQTWTEAMEVEVLPAAGQALDEPPPGGSPPAPRPNAGDTPERALPSFPPAGSAAMHFGPGPALPPTEPRLLVASSHREVVVGQPFVVDYILLLPPRVLGTQAGEVDHPEFEGLWFEEVTAYRRHGWSSHLGTVWSDGHAFEGHMVSSFLVVPLRPGPLELASAGITFDLRGHRRDQSHRRVRSLPLRVDVAPLPAADRPGVIVGTGRASAAWEIDRDRVNEGESVSLRLHVSGIGLAGLWRLPSLVEASAWSAHSLPDVSHQEVDRRVLPRAVREHTWVLRPPAGAHELRLPPLLLYDPWTARYEALDVPPLRLDVSAQASPAEADPTLSAPGTDPRGAASASPQELLEALGQHPIGAERRGWRLPTTSAGGWWLLLALAWLVGVGLPRLWRMRSEPTAAAQAPNRRAPRDALAEVVGPTGSNPVPLSAIEGPLRSLAEGITAGREGASATGTSPAGETRWAPILRQCLEERYGRGWTHASTELVERCQRALEEAAP